jgi:hypothetical protein
MQFMAHMTVEEMKKLADELSGYSFGKASGKLRRLDSQNKLAFFRNAQSPTTLHTRYALPSKGIQVTLVESVVDTVMDTPNRLKPKYTMEEVIVETLPESSVTQLAVRN